MLWMDSVPSTLCQVRKTAARTMAKPGGGHRIGDLEAHVEDVGAHGAEDGHHDDGEPVNRRFVAVSPQLQRHGDDKGDEPEANRDHGVDSLDAVVRRRLAHGRRKDFDHPEEDGDLGNFA